VFVFHTGNAPLYLSEEEMARLSPVCSGSGEERRCQTALCWDHDGQPVYGPPRRTGESPEQIFARAREERRLMNEFCTRREERHGPALSRDLEWMK